MLDAYEARVQGRSTTRARFCWAGRHCLSSACASIRSSAPRFFPRTDAGQFVINLKAPTGTRLEVTEQYVKRVEDIIRQTVAPGDLKTIVSNVGVMADFSALFTSNAAMHTAFVQVGLEA